MTMSVVDSPAAVPLESERKQRSTTAVICGLGGWLPPRVVTNDQLTARLGISDEWIRTRVGVGSRHMLDPGMSTATLATEAGRRALCSAGLDRVDAVVLATTTPDRPCPATAPDVAARLGLAGVAAFDVNAVCSGFVYGLATGSGLIASGAAKSVLLIGADSFSTIVDPEDSTTAAIFGDGAGAVVLRSGTSDEPGAIIDLDLGSDGSQAELIMIPSGGSLSRAGGATGPDDPYFRMDGRATFRSAVLRMSESAGRVMARQSWTAETIDWLVCHQANARILTAVAERMEVPTERVVSNIESVGNTAAASIPLAMLDASRRERATAPRPGDRVLLSAFGAGLSWGSVALTWPSLTI